MDGQDIHDKDLYPVHPVYLYEYVLMNHGRLFFLSCLIGREWLTMPVPSPLPCERNFLKVYIGN